MKKRERLGELLRRHNVITTSQLEAALADQERWGGRIGQHLVRLGAISEIQLLDYLSEQLGVAKIDFKKSSILIDALKSVPKHVCEKHMLIPLAKKTQGMQKRLLIAMSDPLNIDAVREVEFVSNCIVSTVMALESEIRKAIDYCYTIEGFRECRDGLGPEEKALEFIDLRKPADADGAVVFTQEGREMIIGADSRSSDPGLRALVDVLVEKGIIAIEEFRERLEQIKKRT